MSDARRLAAEIAALKKQVRALSTVAALGSSSIEDGTLPVYDEDGNLRQIIGQQDDGAFTTRDYNAPPPPLPAVPIVEPAPAAITVECTGSTADGSAWPSDFDRIEVHVSTVSGFTPTDATQWHAFHTTKGGIVTLNGVPGTTYYVRLIAVNTSNVDSPATAEASAIPEEIVADLSGIQAQVDDAEAAAAQAQSDADAAATAAANAQQAASAAQDTADAANTAAADAQSTADAASNAASAAQGTADAAQTAADAAQSDADAADAKAGQAQSTADAAQQAASAAQSDADAAAQQAADAAGLAGSKADVLIQSTVPAADMQKATTLWIDTTGGANTPKKWDGTGWVAVTDKAALDAADAAAAADSKADAAQSAADAAQNAADAAQSAADAADAKAQQAQSAADAADAKAVDARSAADAAQSTADAANTAAANAQSTADAANTAAGNAQSAADAATTAASNAQSDADAAQSAADAAQADATQAISDANNITSTQITDDAILTRHLTAGVVTAAEIHAGAVVAGKIAAGAVQAGNLAANAVEAGNIAAGAVQAGTIAAGAVDTAELAAGSVTSAEIAAGAVVAGKIDANAVEAGNIAAGAVTVGTIAAGAVVAGTVAADAIGATAIAADAIRTEHIYAEAVTAAEIATGAVVAGKIAANAVTAGTIAAGAVTAGKIDAGAVQAGNLAAGAVQAGNIAADAVEANTIASGAVLADAIASGAVTTAKLDALAVTSDKIAANAIIAGKVDAGAIEAGNLAAGAVVAGNVAAGVIGADEIAADSIEVRHLKVVGINGVANPSFEDGMDPHWPDIIDGFNITVTNTAHHSGTQCLRAEFPTAFASGVAPSQAVVLTANGYYADTQAHPRVQPGETWRFAYFVRSEAATAATGMKAGAQVCDASGLILAEANSAVVNVVDDQWVEVSVDISVPEDQFNAAYVDGFIRVDHAAAGDVMLIDDLSLVRMAGADLIVNGAIDGQTITGAFFRTNTSGARIEINNPDYAFGDAGMIAFYNSDTGWDPGLVYSTFAIGPPDIGTLALQAPVPTGSGASPAQIGLSSMNDGTRRINLIAESVSAIGEIVVQTGMRIGGSNQRLFRALDYGYCQASSDANGLTTHSHSLGEVPVVVMCTPISGGPTRFTSPLYGSMTATDFTVEHRGTDNALLTNNSNVNFFWMAFR